MIGRHRGQLVIKRPDGAGDLYVYKGVEDWARERDGASYSSSSSYSALARSPSAKIGAGTTKLHALDDSTTCSGAEEEFGQEEPEIGEEDDAEIDSQAYRDHKNGLCRPCAWFWKPTGCRFEDECEFCHFCPVGRSKAHKKEKTSKRQDAQLSSKAQLAGDPRVASVSDPTSQRADAATGTASSSRSQVVPTSPPVSGLPLTRFTLIPPFVWDERQADMDIEALSPRFRPRIQARVQARDLRFPTVQNLIIPQEQFAQELQALVTNAGKQNAMQVALHAAQQQSGIDVKAKVSRMKLRNKPLVV